MQTTNSFRRNKNTLGKVQAALHTPALPKLDKIRIISFEDNSTVVEELKGT
jgi:hypothetical protein